MVRTTTTKVVRFGYLNITMLNICNMIDYSFCKHSWFVFLHEGH